MHLNWYENDPASGVWDSFKAEEYRVKSRWFRAGLGKDWEAILTQFRQCGTPRCATLS